MLSYYTVSCSVKRKQRKARVNTETRIIIGCGSMSITNELYVRSVNGEASLAAVNQICVIHEAINVCKKKKSKDSLKACFENGNIHMSRGMRFPTMWYVRPAKPQISLRIRAV